MTGWRRWLRPALRIVAVVVAIGGLYMAITFVQVWRASTRDGARSSGAIIVLGAAQYDGRPSPVLRSRLDHAIELWERDIADVMVLTGGRQPGDRTTEASAGAAYLRSQGVPEEALRLEVDGRNSWESLAASKRFLSEEGITEVILVSDSYHAYRIADIADEIGLDARVSPASSHLSNAGQLRALMRETAAVSVGRIISYRRLMRAENVVDRVRSDPGE